MDELKPRKLWEAVTELEDMALHPSTKKRLSAETLAIAITAINEKAERNRRPALENKPLTLDQIRQMGGEIDELEEAYDNLKFQSDTKDQQIATLKKALEIASTEVNAAFETLESHHVINMTQKGGIQENIDTWIHKANQAQEQKGEK